MPRGIPKKKMMIATETFFSEAGDVTRGQEFAPDHPAVKLNPQWFVSSDRDAQGVESAVEEPV